MRLDRNINPDGKGKYALINLRKNTVEWGNEAPGEQFFVMKYKDIFTAPALDAYAKAVRTDATALAESDPKTANSLFEYAEEMEREAYKARTAGVKIPSSLEDQPADETAGEWEWETFNPSPENRVQDGDEYRNLRLKLPYQDLTQWKPVDSTKIGWDSWVFAGDEFRRRVQKGDQ